MPIDWSRLAAPFPADDIEWKPGATTRDKKKGLAMAYITARAVQERLDEVFTPGGWKNEFRAGPEGGVICRIYFKNDDGDWVWREDGADNTDVEAVKGGLSNAMKRAGAALGIGRYLYKLPQAWVPLDERGRFAQTPRIPREFLPAGSSAPAPANRQREAAPRPTGGRPERDEPRRGAPRNEPPRKETPRNEPRSESRESSSRPTPRAGQKRVIRRVGGQDVGGDGSNRPPARPF
ncbi:MAG TPA: DNA repair protein Rad52 [Bacteroidetes bacterium]|nr:DNA repair protein Rad52 [Bacteroidota bacterium]HIL56476.1 DNA repair protein Rad52 [Rhodothermales bacterium]